MSRFQNVTSIFRKGFFLAFLGFPGVLFADAMVTSSSTYLDFGIQKIGAIVPVKKSLTLTNQDPGRVVTISDVSMSPETDGFDVRDLMAMKGIRMNPSQSLSVSIPFVPESKKLFEKEVKITTDDPSGVPIVVRLRGMGSKEDVVFDKSQIILGQNGGFQVVKITNVGTTQGFLTDAWIFNKDGQWSFGQNDHVFRLDTKVQDIVVDPGQTIEVLFSASDPVATYQALAHFNYLGDGHGLTNVNLPMANRLQEMTGTVSIETFSKNPSYSCQSTPLPFDTGVIPSLVLFLSFVCAGYVMTHRRFDRSSK